MDYLIIISGQQSHFFLRTKPSISFFIWAWFTNGCDGVEGNA
jgi:hypothetical protein